MKCLLRIGLPVGVTAAVIAVMVFAARHAGIGTLAQPQPRLTPEQAMAEMGVTMDWPGRPFAFPVPIQNRRDRQHALFLRREGPDGMYEHYSLQEPSEEDFSNPIDARRHLEERVSESARNTKVRDVRYFTLEPGGHMAVEWVAILPSDDKNPVTIISGDPPVESVITTPRSLVKVRVVVVNGRSFEARCSVYTDSESAPPYLDAFLNSMRVTR